MLSRSFKITAYSVIAFWILLMVYIFVVREGHFSGSGVDLSKLGNISGLAAGNTEYLGIYFQNKKIGYVLNRTEKSGGKLIINHKSLLNIVVQGFKRQANIEGVAELTKDMLLSSFYFKLTTEDRDFIVTGKAEGKRLLIRSNLEGFNDLEIDNSTPVFLDMNINRYIAKKALTHTKRSGFRIFSLEGFSTDTVTVEILGQERIKIMDEEVYATHIKKRYKNFVVDSYIDFNGKTLKEQNELGFTLIRENPEKIDSSLDSLDVISSFSILPDRNVPDIFGVSELKVRLKGIETVNDLNGGRQRIEGDILVIKSELANDIILTKDEEILKKYIKPELFIQSDNSEIISLAREIGKDSMNNKETLEKINDYLFSNIKKKNVIGLPDAVNTLKKMEGDCNEHAILFVALARSLGIPARPAGGVAYLNGRFYFHAWVEAYIDGWRTYDPTWGESPADVGHIRLAYGGIDKILDIAKYINRLQIEVVEWK